MTVCTRKQALTHLLKIFNKRQHNHINLPSLRRDRPLFPPPSSPPPYISVFVSPYTPSWQNVQMQCAVTGTHYPLCICRTKAAGHKVLHSLTAPLSQSCLFLRGVTGHCLTVVRTTASNKIIRKLNWSFYNALLLLPLTAILHLRRKKPDILHYKIWLKNCSMSLQQPVSSMSYCSHGMQSGPGPGTCWVGRGWQWVITPCIIQLHTLRRDVRRCCLCSDRVRWHDSYAGIWQLRQMTISLTSAVAQICCLSAHYPAERCVCLTTSLTLGLCDNGRVSLCLTQFWV